MPVVAPATKIVIITDNVVKKLYADEFKATLEQNGYSVLLLSFNAGEESKNMTTLEYLLDQMLIHRVDRYSVCIAFGGGVVGDISGLASMLFMRGIRYIQVPTTTLSMIDSSIGGKTAVNSVHGKNMIGVFNQPSMVIIDVNLLKTLPDDQFLYGVIEAIKIFLTSDAKYFNIVIKNLTNILNKELSCLTPIIKRAVKLKSEVVRLDEREENLRMILNFGHTVGHALEKLTKYKMPHGLAVGIGILVESKISFMRGLISKVDYEQIIVLFKSFGITTDILKSFKVQDLVDVMLLDKKNKNGEIRCILLKQIGEVSQTSDGLFASMVHVEEIAQVLNCLNS